MSGFDAKFSWSDARPDAIHLKNVLGEGNMEASGIIYVCVHYEEGGASPFLRQLADTSAPCDLIPFQIFSMCSKTQNSKKAEIWFNG